MFFGLFALVFTVAFCLQAAIAEEVTLVGEVNDNFQLVADNEIYEIAETPAGDDLVANHVAEKVAVTGTVEEDDEFKIITVTSFEVVSE
jgi:hypothetical protein